jgi:hypothetical protein
MSYWDVHTTGSLSIRAPFESIDSWDENSILSYHADYESGAVILEAWRTHPTIVGAFEYAIKTYKSPDKYGMRHNVDKLIKDGNTLRVTAKSDYSGSIMLFIFQLLLILMFWGCSCGC